MTIPNPEEDAAFLKILQDAQAAHSTAKTVEDLAAFLIAAGCRGTRKHSLSCPIAKYYTAALRAAGFRDFRIICKVVAQIYAMDGYRIAAALPLTPLERKLLSKFDAGDLPQLEAGYTPPAPPPPVTRGPLWRRILRALTESVHQDWRIRI